MQAVTATTLAIVWWIGTAPTAHAAPTTRTALSTLAITLKVSDERAPDWLCVVTRDTCGPSDRPCPGTTRLGVFVDVLAHHGGNRYGAPRDPASLAAKQLPDDIHSALSALIRTPPERPICSHEDYGACAPELDLSELADRTLASAPASSQLSSAQIVCGAHHGARAAQDEPRDAREDSAPGASDHGPDPDRRPKISRVAFLAVSPRERVENSVVSVKFESNTATLFFRTLQAPHVDVRVVGGDYVASKAPAQLTSEKLLVPLEPRCVRVTAEVPAHTARIAAVVLDGPSLGAHAPLGPLPRETARWLAAAHLARGSDRDPDRAASSVTCIPEVQLARLIPIELPVTSPYQDKTLTVIYETQPRPTRSEARWSESVPPAPLRLGVRSLQFRWRRPLGCLAERWSEPVPKREAEHSSRSCPRATLADSTACRLRQPVPNEQAKDRDICEYHCEIDDALPALSFPIPVVFDRVRAHPGMPPEILYSWRDQIELSGQELSSVVAPADRRVMLEFPDPSAWKDQFGDEIDAIRVVGGQSTTQLDLLDRDRTEVPPRWVSLPTAGRTCSDRVRVAIIGTRRYNETAVPASDGRVELSRPYDYRPHLLFYSLAGGGQLFRHPFSNARSATFGDLGVGGQFDVGGAWSIDAEVTGQLTHTFYAAIELPDRRSSDFTAVPYLRFDVRAALEWWYNRRLGAALALGFGLGTPLESSDAHLVGAIRPSALFEVQPIFTMFPRRLWFLPGAGCRGLEQHMDYHTDFTGSPTPSFERDLQCYIVLRFRAALE